MAAEAAGGGGAMYGRRSTLAVCRSLRVGARIAASTYSGVGDGEGDGVRGEVQRATVQRARLVRMVDGGV